MGSAVAATMDQEAWLSFLVQGWWTLRAIIDQISNRLIVDLNIQHLLMTLADCLRVGGARMDSLGLDRLLMSRHQSMWVRFLIRLIKWHVGSSILSLWRWKERCMSWVQTHRASSGLDHLLKAHRFRFCWRSFPSLGWLKSVLVHSQPPCQLISSSLFGEEAFSANSTLLIGSKAWIN